MLNSFKDIYVCCPANLVTGGPEALHQLVDAINSMNGSAYIVYTSGSLVVKANTPLKFKHYKVKLATEIIDLKVNACVVPETGPDILKELHNLYKFVWWLSWDYGKDILTTIDTGVIHLYQSKYAKNMLFSSGVEQAISLSDYTLPPLFNEGKKQNLVLLAGRKISSDYLEMHKTIKKEFTFIEVKNLSQLALAKYLKRSKCYVDFGLFPGKDRLPREAVIMNNLIVTSQYGACSNLEDFAIQESFRLKMEMTGPELVDYLNGIILDYSIQNDKFVKFKTVVYGEKDMFFSEVSSIFGLLLVAVPNPSKKRIFHVYIEHVLWLLGFYKQLGGVNTRFEKALFYLRFNVLKMVDRRVF
jgi:hypothetical protein